MTPFIDDILPALKILGYITSSSLVTGLVMRWLGKSKEQAEIILNYEEINNTRELKLLREIKRLEDKIDKFVEEMDALKENHVKEIQLWEESDRKKDIIIKEKDKRISELMKNEG